MTVFSTLLQGLSAFWVGSEIFLVVRDGIQDKGRTEKDRGSRYFILISIIGGMAAGAIVNRSAAFFFAEGRTTWLSWAGVITMLLGMSLRLWAIVTLGKSFRTTVETHHDQRVCRDGPYKLVRHPAYSRVLLICIGFGLAVQNWLSLTLAVVPPVAALLYRIRVEETELVAALGSEYLEYQKQTKRLIPWIW